MDLPGIGKFGPHRCVTGIPHSAPMMLRLFSLLLATSLSLAPARGETPAKPKGVTLTYYVSGVECTACLEMVRQSLEQVQGITDVWLEQRIESVANITFDPKVTSAHQVAQGVLNAVPLHGKPYEPSLQLSIPDYGKPGVAARVESVFQKQKPWVEISAMNKEKGEFLLFFVPLEKKDQKGWDHVAFTRALEAAVGGTEGSKAWSFVREEGSNLPLRR